METLSHLFQQAWDYLSQSAIFAWTVFLLKIVGSIYVLVVVAMVLLETWLVYPAPKYPAGLWDNHRFQAEEAHFRSKDGTQLHGWFFEAPEPRATILYCHGNGDCVGFLGDYAASMRDRFGVQMFIFDYRGYGKSDGSPHEKGVLQDGEAARDWLCERTGKRPEELLLMGRSLGGGVAVHLAANGGAKGLVLQNTFSSLHDTAAENYPFVPVRLLMRNKMDSMSRIGRFQGPLLMSHGDADTLIPFRLSQRLFEKANEPKQFFTVRKGEHCSTEPEEYQRLFDRFLSSSAPAKTRATGVIHAEE